MTKYQNCLTYFSLLNDDEELVLFTNPKLDTLNHALKNVNFPSVEAVIAFVTVASFYSP